MIPAPSGARVWLASGRTDMRKGFDGLALLVQETLKRDPHGGHLFVFRGRRGGLIKVLWHDGQGLCLFAKRLERGRFIWPSPTEGVVTISSAQLGYLEGIDWRMPQRTGGLRRPADCGISHHDTVARSQAHRLVIPSLVMSIDDSLPTDLASAHALIIAQRQALSAAEQRATAAESEAQYRALLIEKLKFTIGKLRHDRFGQSSERGALLDQLELQLADLEADAAQADAAAQMVAAAASEKMMVPSFERRRPARRPLPEHLPRERIVYPAPSACRVAAGRHCARSART